MGGATGNAFANTLEASGLTPAAELAREAIQNSCDAANAEERRVRVISRIESLEGKASRRFLKDLRLTGSFSQRLPSLRIALDYCLENPSRPLCLVFVEDYGTVGLRGDPHDLRSHLYRLLLSVGDSAEAFEGQRSGGSYGYGKSALSLNSRLRTIVAYSCFEPDETGATARLMACAYFDAHEFKGRQWTGRARFGVERPGSAPVVDPRRDAVAHDLAERLGFRRRKADEHGTSILIVDSDVRDPEPLLRAIEDWWWPRLLDHELEIGARRYRVVRVGVHSMWDAAVAPPMDETQLALVTCYPFAGLSGTTRRYLVVCVPVPSGGVPRASSAPRPRTHSLANSSTVSTPRSRSAGACLTSMSGRIPPFQSASPLART